MMTKGAAWRAGAGLAGTVDMRILTAISALAICAGMLTACGPTATNGVATGTAAIPAPSGSGFKTLLNDARTARSLNPLKPDSRLETAAQGHADDMSINGYFSHVGLDGRGVGQRVRDAGYRYCWAGENIAWGQTSQKQVFKAWMNSAPHKANMLSARAREFGLGHANAGNYWVLVLAEPGC